MRLYFRSRAAEPTAILKHVCTKFVHSELASTRQTLNRHVHRTPAHTTHIASQAPCVKHFLCVAHMGPPKCSCGQNRTELVTASLRARWAEGEGESWEWYTPKQAYWFYCWRCHLALWTQDHRSRNGSSRPGPYAPTFSTRFGAFRGKANECGN